MNYQSGDRVVLRIATVIDQCFSGLQDVGPYEAPPGITGTVKHVTKESVQVRFEWSWDGAVLHGFEYYPHDTSYIRKL